MRRGISILVIVAILCVSDSATLAASGSADNAALLYYQVFAMWPEKTDAEFQAIDDVLRGAEPNAIARSYLGRARDAMDLVETAAKTRGCIWGIEDHVTSNQLGGISSQLRQIAFALEVDARICAVDGDYRAAFEKVLNLRRMARHISQEAQLGYLTSLALDGRAFKCLQYILGRMEPTADTLIWLQGQLGHVQGPPESMGQALEIEFEDALHLYEANPEYISEWRDATLSRIDDDALRDELTNLTEAEILERGRASFEAYLSSVHRSIAGLESYHQKRIEIQTLTEALSDRYVTGDPVGLFQLVSVVLDRPYDSPFDLHTRATTHFNAIRAAIEIYLLYVETGTLPETLPANLPKDACSGNDFEYEVTDDGFLLCSPDEEIREYGLWEFEFIVSRNN